MRYGRAKSTRYLHHRIDYDPLPFSMARAFCDNYTRYFAGWNDLNFDDNACALEVWIAQKTGCGKRVCLAATNA